MSYIETEIDESKLFFTTQIEVLINHINYGNHLGHDAMLLILQEARIRFLKQNNMSEISIEKNIGLLVTDVSVKYKTECFHGDLLEVKMGVIKTSKISCEFLYSVKNLTTNKTAAIAKIRAVFYDFNNKKIIAIPSVFLSSVKNSVVT